MDGVGMNQCPISGTPGTCCMLGTVSGDSVLLRAITEDIKRIKSYFLLYSGPNCSYLSTYIYQKCSTVQGNGLPEIY